MSAAQGIVVLTACLADIIAASLYLGFSRGRAYERRKWNGRDSRLATRLETLGYDPASVAEALTHDDYALLRRTP